MSSSNLSFKINANKTINVEYSFSPFYSLILYTYTLYTIVKLKASSLNSDHKDLNVINKLFINNFEPEFYNNEETKENIEKLYDDLINEKFDKIKDGSDLYQHYHLNENKDINEFINESIKDINNNKNKINYSFYIYYYLMFEQFYNLKYLLSDPNTLVILPVYTNSTITSIEDYINKMPIKDLGIKSRLKKEIINLINSFKKKDASTDNNDKITNNNNVFFLKCIYKNANFTEEEYKENIDTEFIRLTDTLKERFQNFMSTTNQKYLPYKKIILFKNSKNDISIDYFSDTISKKNNTFLNKNINDFFKSNKYYNINSGIQSFNYNEKIKIPLIYTETNHKNILQFYNLEEKKEIKKLNSYKSTVEALHYLIYLTQFLYKVKFLGEKKEELKDIAIKTESFKILYKKNKINIDEYNIKIHVAKNTPYNIELSSISNTIELHGYFKQKKGNYYILQLNKIYNNDLFNFILHSFRNTSNQDKREATKIHNKLTKYEKAIIKDMTKQKIETFLGVNKHKGAHINKGQINSSKSFIDKILSCNYVKSDVELYQLLYLMYNHDKIYLKIVKNEYIFPVQLYIRNQRTFELIENGILKNKPDHIEYKFIHFNNFNRSLPYISNINYYNNFLITKRSVEQYYLDNEETNKTEKENFNIKLMKILVNKQELDNFYLYCQDHPSFKSNIYDYKSDEQMKAKRKHIIKTIVNLLFELYTPFYITEQKDQSNNKKSTAYNTYQINNKNLKNIFFKDNYSKNTNFSIREIIEGKQSVKIKNKNKNEDSVEDEETCKKSKNKKEEDYTISDETSDIIFKTNEIVILDLDIIEKKDSINMDKTNCNSRKNRITKKITNMFNKIYKNVTRKNLKQINNILYDDDEIKKKMIK